MISWYNYQYTVQNNYVKDTCIKWTHGNKISWSSVLFSIATFLLYQFYNCIPYLLVFILSMPSLFITDSWNIFFTSATGLWYTYLLLHHTLHGKKRYCWSEWVAICPGQTWYCTGFIRPSQNILTGTAYLAVKRCFRLIRLHEFGPKIPICVDGYFTCVFYMYTYTSLKFTSVWISVFPGQRQLHYFFTFRLTLRDLEHWGSHCLWVVWIMAVIGIWYQYTYHEQ
jgi:hypothetical protein